MRTHPVSGMWMSAYGGEVFHDVDLPGCCRNDARSYRDEADEFECSVCGAAWQGVSEAQGEFCEFMNEDGREERGAA